MFDGSNGPLPAGATTAPTVPAEPMLTKEQGGCTSAPIGGVDTNDEMTPHIAV